MPSTKLMFYFFILVVFLAGVTSGNNVGGVSFMQCNQPGQACATTADCCAGQCVNYKCSTQETIGPATRVDIIAPPSALLNDVISVKMVDETNNSVAGGTILIISPSKESMVLMTDTNGEANFKATDEGVYTYNAPGHYIMAIKSTYVVKPDKTPASLAETTPQQEGQPREPTSVGMSLAAYAPLAVGLLVLLLIVFFLATPKKNGNNKK